MRIENSLRLTPCRCTVRFRSLDFSNQIERARDTYEIVPPGKRPRLGKGFARIFNDFDMAEVTRFDGRYQIARRCHPLLFRTRQYQHVREREDPFQHPGVVLVAKSAEYDDQPPVRKIREQGFPQRRNPRGLWAPSTTTRGSRAISSSRPSQRASRNPSSTDVSLDDSFFRQKIDGPKGQRGIRDLMPS